ncbi:MAG: pyridoxamine 5'-phosphate oxidase family protein, partial [Deltaproteobacteria bacterium]|nr:pyridoxamine 5'-phosphate oxidase family protein [Deltaproteobacteria bacterium]
MNIPENIKALLEDPNAIKTVTTVNREGNPHSVPVNSFSVMDDGNLAFLVLLDTCNTQKNMLNCYWFKKDVSILVMGDWGKEEVFQIKGTPYKFLTEGPIWDKYLDMIWKIIPEADPSGVWLITPKEIRDQNYFARRKGEEERRKNWTKWLTFKGARG